MSRGQNHTRPSDRLLALQQDDVDVVFADTCKLMTSGNSIGGRIPQPYARNMGLNDLVGTKCVETYINKQAGLAIFHFNPEGEDLEDLLSENE